MPDRELVHRDDVRVLELPRHLRFGNETVAVERLARQLFVEPFEGYVAEQVPIGGGMDSTHAASTELRKEPEMRRRGDALHADLLRAHLMIAPDRDRFDDVDRLYFRFVLHPKCRTDPSSILGPLSLSA
jgi:hypothetical protein